MAQTILITGATGFIGSRLAVRLAAAGETIIGMGRTGGPGPWKRFIEWDLADPDAPVPDLHGIDLIFHFASKAHALSERPGASDGYHDVIVDGTRRLLAAAEQAGVPSLLYLSSVKAIGEGQGIACGISPIGESEPCCPASPYGKAKAAAEQLVLHSAIQKRWIIRPTMVYGEGQKGNLLRMFEAVKRGRFPLIPETGNRRSMVHVDDLLDAALSLTEHPELSGQTYIITGSDSPSTRELINAIRDALGLPPTDSAIPLWVLKCAANAGTLLGLVLRRRMPLDRDTLDKLIGSAWYCSTKAIRDFGYFPIRPVTTTLRSMAG